MSVVGGLNEIASLRQWIARSLCLVKVLVIQGQNLQTPWIKDITKMLHYKQSYFFLLIWSSHFLKIWVSIALPLSNTHCAQSGHFSKSREFWTPCVQKCPKMSKRSPKIPRRCSKVSKSATKFKERSPEQTKTLLFYTILLYLYL